MAARPTPLRALIVEDRAADADLILRELKRGGFVTAHERVETAETLRAALDKQAWDIVLSDYYLPTFDAPGALAVLQASGHDVPFIVVSGSVGEDTAVAAMRAGATDYIMKDRLQRLPPAVVVGRHRFLIRVRPFRIPDAFYEVFVERCPGIRAFLTEQHGHSKRPALPRTVKNQLTVVTR